jgi:hypothetical protein
MRKSLHELEDIATKEYISFLRTLSTVGSDGTIQTDQILKGTDYILQILDTNNGNSHTKELKNFILQMT